MNLLDLASSREYFLNEVWRKKYHLSRQAVDAPGDILSLEDVDSLVSERGLRRPGVTVVRDGKELNPGSYTYRDTEGTGGFDGLYDPAGIAAELTNGSSLTIRGLEHSWPPVKRTCRSLELELCHPIQANAYLSPPGSRGYPLHHDIHDVFVVQTVGSKEWEVHEPGASRKERPGRQRRFKLDVGDCLYLPQGWQHRAWTTESSSLHVTFGVRAKTYADAVRALLAEVMPAEVAAPLPPGYPYDPGALAEDLRRHLLTLAALVKEKGAARRVISNLWETRRPPLDGHLHDSLGLASVSVQDTVRWRLDHVYALDFGDDCVILYLWDRRLTFSLSHRRALEQLMTGENIKIATIANLDAAEALDLARTLIDAGIVRLV